MASYQQIKTQINNLSYTDGVVREVVKEQDVDSGYTLYEVTVIAIDEYDERYVARVQVASYGNTAHVVRGRGLRDPAYRKSVLSFLDGVVSAGTAGVVAYDNLHFLNSSDGAEVTVYRYDAPNDNVVKNRYFIDKDLNYKELVEV